MKISVKNLGVLEHSEIDLSKKLNILCGANNTGKTYMAYLVYQLFDIISTGDIVNVNTSFIKSTDNIAEKLIKNGAKEIFINSKEFHDFLTSFKEDFIKKFTQFQQQQLSKFFASEDNLFSDTQLYLELPNDFESIVKKKIIANDYNYVSFIVGVEGVKTLPLLIIKQGKTDKLSFNLNGNIIQLNGIRLPFFDSLEKKLLNEQDILLLKKSINHVVYSMISKEIDNLVNKVYMVPAERSAVNIFSNELNLVKATFFNNENPINNGKINRYPKPIQDSLLIANDLLNKSKQKTKFGFLADELEQKILKGNISVGQYGDLRYSPAEISDLKLEMHVSASMVKSLSSIVFYFRHLAQAGDLIIIDEPELNLHPDMQRAVARLLARFVNEGFKVLISTHSDYIIKELNLLIMLNNPDKPEAKELQKKYGYQDNELLKPEEIGVYLFKDRHSEVVPVSQEGFEIETIDKEINELNHAFKNIYFSLYD